MRSIIASSIIVAIAASFVGAASSVIGAPTALVSSQGLLAAPGLGGSGEPEWRAEIVEGTVPPFLARVSMSLPGGSRRSVEAKGEAFFVSDLGIVMSVRRPETRALPAVVTATDLDGAIIWEKKVRDLACPIMSPRGRALAYLHSGGTSVIDLNALVASSSRAAGTSAGGETGASSQDAGATRAAEAVETVYPKLLPFTVSDDGRLAGVSHDAAGGPDTWSLRLFDPSDLERRVATTERPRRLAFAPDGSVLVLYGTSLHGWSPPGEPEIMYVAPEGAELRDLDIDDGEVLVGLRVVEGRVSCGRLVVLSESGEPVRVVDGPRRLMPGALEPVAATGDSGGRGIPWPLAPNEQHEVGNTYGEYQNYGGSPYLHPGVDVMGAGGQPVYAVAPGVVKAVLTTSGQWHWRVAVADSATSGMSTGYLYAHLDAATIVHSVGDTVAEGEYLGDLVTWPVAGFHHCHFARVEDEGAQWYGSWMATDNPHTDFDQQSESEAPVFEPAVGTDLLAFCTNQTSTYLDPDALQGEVDIIAHVGDRIESSSVCTVQELRYTIYPVGYPQFPVVDSKLAVNFDMALDTYIGGPIDPFLVGLLFKQDSTCRTRGDYDFREFYHIITNSDGDETYESSDLDQAWDTTALPDAQYVVRVTAVDAAGNASADSMTVTTANGNPADVPEQPASSLSLAGPHPNPASHATSLSYSLGTDCPVELSVYSTSGRLVRTLVDTGMSEGPKSVEWDLRDSRGNEVASGVYFVRLEAGDSALARKLIVVR